MLIGENIKKARKNAGLSQKELAVLMGISPQMVSMYETGQRNPKYKTLVNFANVLNVSLTELNPDWLKGLDALFIDPPEAETDILNSFHKLNKIGQNEAVKRVEELTYIDKYTKKEE